LQPTGGTALGSWRASLGAGARGPGAEPSQTKLPDPNCPDALARLTPRALDTLHAKLGTRLSQRSEASKPSRCREVKKRVVLHADGRQQVRQKLVEACYCTRM